MSLHSLLPLAGLTLLTMGATPALAQDGPSLDCEAASTSAEELVCSDPELAVLDRRLQTRFEAAVDAAEARLPAALPDLRAMQRGWVKGRDDCWKGRDLRDCVEFNYLHREAQLVAAWALDEPVWVATYDCAEVPEVQVSFYETELPSVRIERGAETDVAVLDTSGTDTNYVSDLGSTLLVDADDAWLQWLGGPEEACALRVG
jgi:uncharacterized protein